MSPTQFRIESPAVVVRRVVAFREAMAVTLLVSLVASLKFPAARLVTGIVPQDGLGWTFVACLLVAVVSAATLAWSYFFDDPTVAAARAQARAGTIELADGAITAAVDGKRHRYETKRITAGWIEPVDGGHVAVLRVRGGDLISVRVDEATEAQALLRAAGVSAERMALRLKLPSRADQQVAGRSAAVAQLTMLGAVGLPSLAFFGWLIQEALRSDDRGLSVLLGVVAVGMVLSAGLLVRIIAFLVPPAVVVGTDGVAIQRGRWRRYLPYRHVASVQKYPLGVRIRMRDRKEILLPTWTYASVHAAQRGASEARRRAARVDEARREVLYERIRAAMGSGGGDLAGAELRLLDRAGRSLQRWREDLGKLLEGATYRAAGLDQETLEQVLSDPGATPSRRVAAAFALSRTGDGAVRERARIATEACADQRLRVAILRAADGEIDEVAEALETEAPAPLRRAL